MTHLKKGVSWKPATLTCPKEKENDNENYRRSLTICLRLEWILCLQRTPHGYYISIFITSLSKFVFFIISSVRESLTYPIFIVITLCFDYYYWGLHEKSFFSHPHMRNVNEKFFASSFHHPWPWTWMPNLFSLTCLNIEILKLPFVRSIELNM